MRWASAFICVALPFVLFAWRTRDTSPRALPDGLPVARPSAAGAMGRAAGAWWPGGRRVQLASAFLCVMVPFVVFAWVIPWLSLGVVPDDVLSAGPARNCITHAADGWASPLYASATSVASEARFPERLAEFSEEVSGRIEFTSVTAALLFVSLAAFAIAAWVICVFHAIVGTDFRGSWAVISRHHGHPL